MLETLLQIAFPNGGGGDCEGFPYPDWAPWKADQ